MTNAGRQAAGAAEAGLDAGDDAALIARSLHAPECFGVLFDRHAPAIGRYITRRLGPDAADDLVAETFLAAFRRRGHYDLTHGDARPWLYGIATRLIGRHRRQEVRFFRAIARTGVDPAAEAVTDQVIDRIAAQGARRELAAALAQLSRGQRDVLLLVASGLGYEEAARALAVPAGTVSSRLFRPDGKTAYVLSSTVLGGGLGTVTPIRTATNTALAPIRVGRYPQAIVITPDGRTAYVLDGGPGTVTPIRTATNTALAPITVPAGSFSMAITPDGTTIYVLDLGSSQHQEGMVVPIRTATNTALRPIRIGHAWPSTINIAITPDSRTAYVANAGTGTVIPIRTATNTALAPVRLADGAGPIAITPDGRTAYVIADSAPGRRGTVISIRTATNQVLRAIAVGDLPSVIAITPALRR